VNFESVEDDEKLSRFVVQSNLIRQFDKSVRSKAFFPYKGKVSVTRHLNLSDQEVFQIGQKITDKRKVTFYGRAEVSAKGVRDEELEVDATPNMDNPNHADIINWPKQKDIQKMIALNLAEKAKVFLIR